MAVTSQRVTGWVTIAGPPNITTIYDVPAGRTFILRTILLHNRNAAAATGYLYLQAITSPARGLLQYSLAAGESKQVELWVACNPGDDISGSCSLATAVSVCLTGSLLIGAPS